MSKGIVSGTLSRTDSLKPSDLPDDVLEQVVKDCESKACKKAKQRLIPARNKILSLCANLKAKEIQRNIYLGIAAGFITVAAAIFAAAEAAAASIIGIPGAIALIILGSIMAAVGASFLAAGLVIEFQMIGIRSEIAARQAEWQMLVEMIMDACPDYCWPDLDIPTCR